MQGFLEHSLHLQHWRNAKSFVEDTAERPAWVLTSGDPQSGDLVRIHSRCVYGELGGSMDCDCGYQLQQAMALIERAGAGVLIYLDQEGRGSGLANKARGYRLTQTRGVDTFQAYRELDLPEDQRDYAVAVKALQGLGLTAIRLLTNNPQKVLEVARAGIQVERVPLVPPEWAESRDYIQAKRARGHLV